jgi:hypothetical protein
LIIDPNWDFWFEKKAYGNPALGEYFLGGRLSKITELAQFIWAQNFHGKMYVLILTKMGLAVANIGRIFHLNLTWSP